MRTALLLAVSIVVLPGLTRAEDDPACAKFEEPLAYNACLAAHGPRAKDVGVSPEPAPAREIDRVSKAPAEAARPAWRLPAVARRHGRVHLEFRVR